MSLERGGRNFLQMRRVHGCARDREVLTAPVSAASSVRKVRPSAVVTVAMRASGEETATRSTDSGKGNRVKFVPSVASSTRPFRPTNQQTRRPGEAPASTSSFGAMRTGIQMRPASSDRSMVPPASDSPPAVRIGRHHRRRRHLFPQLRHRADARRGGCASRMRSAAVPARPVRRGVDGLAHLRRARVVLFAFALRVPQSLADCSRARRRSLRPIRASASRYPRIRELGLRFVAPAPGRCASSRRAIRRRGCGRQAFARCPAGADGLRFRGRLRRCLAPAPIAAWRLHRRLHRRLRHHHPDRHRGSRGGERCKPPFPEPGGACVPRARRARGSSIGSVLTTVASSAWHRSQVEACASAAATPAASSPPSIQAATVSASRQWRSVVTTRPQS